MPAASVDTRPTAGALPILASARSASSAIPANPSIPEVRRHGRGAGNRRADSAPIFLAGAGRGPARRRRGMTHLTWSWAEWPFLVRPDRVGECSGWPSAVGSCWETSTTRPLGSTAGIGRRAATRCSSTALNQCRETPRLMREAAHGGEFLFFAADPDFQVAVLDDPRSYPRSTTRYRQTVVACSGPKARGTRSRVFDVSGRAPARPVLPRTLWRFVPMVGLGPDGPRPRVAPAADDTLLDQHPGRGRPLVRSRERRV